MSSKKFWTAHIDDIQRNGVDGSELEMLCDIFESLMKKASAALIRKAEFNMADFPHAEDRGIELFTLTLEKLTITTADQWQGTFTDGRNTLILFGTLVEE